jgi:NitT/TauT family transport system permease protein
MPYHRHLLHNLMRASLGMRVAAIFAALALVLVVAAIAFEHPWTAARPWRVNPGEVLLAGAATMSRLLVAYGLSVVLAVAAAFVVTTYPRAEMLLMPVFDVLQSVPVLAFFPVAVLLFARFGFYEGAAQLVLLTAMLWSLLFSIVSAVRAIPRDVRDAARIYGAKGLKYWRYVVLPASFPAIVTGSILAFGAGWNVVIVAEFINYGGKKITLTGLGSMLDYATQSDPPDMPMFVASLVVLVTIILLVNRLIWHRLVIMAEKYKLE